MQHVLTYDSGFITRFINQKAGVLHMCLYAYACICLQCRWWTHPLCRWMACLRWNFFKQMLHWISRLLTMVLRLLQRSRTCRLLPWSRVPRRSSIFCRCLPCRNRILRCLPCRSSILWCLPCRSSSLRCLPCRSRIFWCLPCRISSLRCHPCRSRSRCLRMPRCFPWSRLCRCLPCQSRICRCLLPWWWSIPWSRSRCKFRTAWSSLHAATRIYAKLTKALMSRVYTIV